MEVFVEPLLPKPIVVVIGAGHVGKAVAHLAHWLGFQVVVNDDRPGFCTPEHIPNADQYLPVEMAELPRHLEITPWTYLVLTTRGVNVDVEGLPALLDTPAAYIGVIGSQRRWSTARQQMLAQGVASEKFDRVHSPIGLELNAETPEEIAGKYPGRNNYAAAGRRWRCHVSRIIKLPKMEYFMWQEIYSVTSIEEAINLLGKYGEKSRIVAGATDLILEIERGVRKGIEVLSLI